MRLDILYLVVGVIGGCVGSTALYRNAIQEKPVPVVKDYEPVPDDKKLVEIIRMGEGEERAILNNDAGW